MSPNMYAAYEVRVGIMADLQAYAAEAVLMKATMVRCIGLLASTSRVVREHPASSRGSPDAAATAQPARSAFMAAASASPAAVWLTAIVAPNAKEY